MKYIQVIEELANSKPLHEGNINKFSKEVLQIAANTLGCQRTNAWLFNKDNTILKSINAFDARNLKFTIEENLERKELPSYFNFLTKNEIIVSNDAISSQMNAELLDSYIIPNGIKSMIDVPLRSEGKMIGVICFEFVNVAYKWTDSDQKFVQSLAQLVSLAIETNQKNIYRRQLEKTIKQKEVLLYEINHRVKNNMAVIISLINLQKEKAKDNYHSKVLDELKSKIYSMAVVQNNLHNNKSIVKVELSKYLKEIVQNLNDSFGQEKDIDLTLKFDKAVIDISKGIPLGLIANEALTNSFKYAFNKKGNANKLSVTIERYGNNVSLCFKDNGPGYNPLKVKEGMGLELIRDLTEQIEGKLELSIEDGVNIQITFQIF